jgi:hypothetical protein
VEIWIVRPDNTERIVLGDAVAVADVSGNPIRMVGILLDITEQRRAEQQRFELALEKERIEILRQSLAHLSHDLKTSLGHQRKSTSARASNRARTCPSRIVTLATDLDLRQQYLTPGSLVIT